MSVLKGKRAYLSSAIQHAQNHNWRDAAIKVLREEFEIDLFDPFNDPKQQWLPLLEEAVKNKDYETMTKISKDFVSKDLTMVSRSDMLIAYLPYKSITCGLHHEVIWSHMDKKPTIIVCEDGIEKIPLWYWGILKWQDAMFSSWEDLYKFLREVNEGKHNDKKRWRYINGLI